MLCFLTLLNVSDLAFVKINKDFVNYICVIFSDFFIFEPLTYNKIKVTLQGSFLPLYYGNMSKNWLSVWFQLIVLQDVSKKSRKMSNSNIVLVQVIFFFIKNKLNNIIL